MKKPPATKAPIAFQDHGNPVHFRNVWLREIPCRHANTTHGGPDVKEADVKALRHKIAEQLFAKIDTNKSGADEVNAILEVISYCKAEPFCGACKKICGAYIARLDAMDAAALDKAKGEIMGVKKSCDVLARNKVVENCRLAAKINEIVKARGWDKKKK